MSDPALILIVDDEPDARRIVRLLLTREKFEVIEAGGGHDMYRQLARQTPDLILLDLGLPDVDGWLAARELINERRAPVIILSGRAETADKVLGLELGAEDYVTKPYSGTELVARVRRVLRRQSLENRKKIDTLGEDVELLEFKGWRFNLNANQLVSPSGKEVKLTPHEFGMLKLLALYPGRCIGRDRFASMLGGYDLAVDGRSVDVKIAKLRKKMNVEPGGDQLIHTVRGRGYMLVGTVDVTRLSDTRDSH